ncbi:RNA polymerase sigma factor [Crenothrix polyspora]|uniref:RNA polymerase sigma factor n=1 Tax=Crenothrix polyspora TaxID=360316 RepID=A0A1R4HDP7_9GAMM|nr:RNA polymerase sigma factor RpoD/SigA [Crenothrix polyspora]SJM94334.1 RNA polymerase sigma factor [Crenothrix polyspora]
MAYLDRQLSEYKTSAPYINVIDEAKNTKTDHDKPVDEIKNSNHQLAKNLADAKTDLIKSLATFPISALWLINKHEQNIDTIEPHEPENIATDLAVSITQIKKDFLQLHQHAQGNETNHEFYIGCKQRLVVHLQLFPYSFDDLVELSELIVYKFKAGSVFNPFLNRPLGNDTLVVDKRLKAALTPSKAKNLEKFTATYDSQYNESFLLLASNDIYSDVSRVIVAEQRWLKGRQNLVMANNKLVSFIVNQYKGSFLDFNDLVQEGQTGLLKAVDRFDYRLGFQFSTYAGYWIRQAISRSLSRSERSVRIPCEQIANINRVFRAKDQITTRTGKEASIQEIAGHTQLSCDDINTILAIAQSAIPLEGTDDEDNEKAFAPVDFLEQQTFTHAIEDIAGSELEALIADAIKTLNPREAQVVCCHFGVHSSSEMTLQEIGAEFNLTRERIRQIQVIALNKIKLNYGQQLINFL